MSKNTKRLPVEQVEAVVRAAMLRSGVEWVVTPGKGWTRIQPKSHEAAGNLGARIYVPNAKVGVGEVHLSGFCVEGPGVVPNPVQNGRVKFVVDFSAEPAAILGTIANVVLALAALPAPDTTRKAPNKATEGAPEGLTQDGLAELLASI